MFACVRAFACVCLRTRVNVNFQVFSILSHAVRKNQYLNAYAGKAKFFEAWKQILDEALYKS